MFLISQQSVPCAVYRGGTSRGIFFHEKDLPRDKKKRENIFLAGIDAYNPSQINGLGSGTSHTSKVIVISEPSVKEAVLDYTFYQIGIGEAVVDAEGTCGNLMAAVGAFAVDEGLVNLDILDKETTVFVFNKNIQKMIKLNVPVINGKAQVSGDYHMPGTIIPGAKFEVDILSPGGGITGKSLPLGSTTKLEVSEESFDASFADIVNPFVFTAAESFCLKGSEPNSKLSQDAELMSKLESIRLKASVLSGMAETEKEAMQIPSIPKIAILSKPHDYTTSKGELIKAEDVDIVAKMVSMGKFHRTFAGSGLYNLAASALLPGTIANSYTSKRLVGQSGTFRIGHPEGVAVVRVALTKNGMDIESVGLDRTARLILKGLLYIPEL
ncbi:PrpF domain-containing protein [Paenisporosarcina antarctica]|uniref:PrpF domain-containing protein n=1 Tax=Paenisporosarcina antarctica TaxID=417367 RepID=UPI001FBB0AB0|nr:PrpF domain-containing protein [Paenisporosarcina antarctica]